MQQNQKMYKSPAQFFERDFFLPAFTPAASVVKDCL